MADYKFIAYNIDGGSTVSGYTYETYKEVFKMVTETILPMSVVEKVEITRNGEVIEILTKKEREMVEKIKISKDLNKWLEKHPTLDGDNEMYSERFGGLVFGELVDDVWLRISDTKKYDEILEAFGLRGNSKTAHLWLIMNRDKWEVKQDELFYICIPEADGVNAWLDKSPLSGLEFFSEQPHGERFKWTQEEIDKHEVAKHLQHFKKAVEK